MEDRIVIEVHCTRDNAQYVFDKICQMDEVMYAESLESER